MLPANAPILAALALPDEYAVTNAAQYGVAAQLARMENRLRLPLVPLDEKHAETVRAALKTANAL